MNRSNMQYIKLSVAIDESLLLFKSIFITTFIAVHINIKDHYGYLFVTSKALYFSFLSFPLICGRNKQRTILKVNGRPMKWLKYYRNKKYVINELPLWNSFLYLTSYHFEAIDIMNQWFSPFFCNSSDFFSFAVSKRLKQLFMKWTKYQFG